MYEQVQGSRAPGVAPLVASHAPIRAIQSIERFVLKAVRALEDWQQRRAAIRDLRRLNDHILHDLGIERDRIEEVAEAQVAARR